MTRNITSNEIKTPAEIEQLLRDAAFVLKMTRRVKEDLFRDAERPSHPRRKAMRAVDQSQFGTAV